MRTRAWAAPGQTVQVQIPGRHPLTRNEGAALAQTWGQAGLRFGLHSPGLWPRVLSGILRPAGVPVWSGFVSDGGQSFRRGEVQAAREGSYCYRGG